MAFHSPYCNPHQRIRDRHLNEEMAAVRRLYLYEAAIGVDVIFPRYTLLDASGERHELPPLSSKVIENIRAGDYKIESIR